MPRLGKGPPVSKKKKPPNDDRRKADVFFPIRGKKNAPSNTKGKRRRGRVKVNLRKFNWLYQKNGVGAGNGARKSRPRVQMSAKEKRDATKAKSSPRDGYHQKEKKGGGLPRSRIERACFPVAISLPQGTTAAKMAGPATACLFQFSNGPGEKMSPII